MPPVAKTGMGTEVSVNAATPRLPVTPAAADVANGLRHPFHVGVTAASAPGDLRSLLSVVACCDTTAAAEAAYTQFGFATITVFGLAMIVSHKLSTGS
jgi:hypothetical protein